MQWSRISHMEACQRNLVPPGASVWVLRPGTATEPREGEPDEGDVDDGDRVGQGEAVSFRPADMAWRLWTLDSARPAVVRGRLRLSVKSTGALLVGDVDAVDAPRVGVTQWGRPPATWRTLERRRAFRVAVSIYAGVWREDGQGPVVRRVVNLSVGGCALEGIPARVGERVTLSLDLQPVSGEFRTAGRVVRQDGPPLGGYTGIRFDEADAAQPALLQYLLMVSGRQLREVLGPDGR